MARIITVAHQKGGVGKSTLTLNLAYCFSSGMKTAICDTDLQGSIQSLGILADGINLIKLPESIEELKFLPYDLVLVDTPPYLSNKLPEIFVHSDFILIPTKAGFFDILAIKSTIEMVLKSMNVNTILKAGIIFNMVKGSSSITSEILSLTKEFKIPILKGIVSDRVSFTRSVLSGGVLQTSDEKAISEIIALADEILSQMGL